MRCGHHPANDRRCEGSRVHDTTAYEAVALALGMEAAILAWYCRNGAMRDKTGVHRCLMRMLLHTHGKSNTAPMNGAMCCKPIDVYLANNFKYWQVADPVSGVAPQMRFIDGRRSQSRFVYCLQVIH